MFCMDTAYRPSSKITDIATGIVPGTFVWNYTTFHNNFEIENDFTNFLNESCR